MRWLLAARFGVLGLAGCTATMPVTQNAVVLAASPADQPGENTGAGAVAGAILLGGAGGAAGSAAGKALAITAGIIVGASAGTAVEAARQKHDGIAYTVQFSDGQVLTLIQHLDTGDRVFAPGSMVTVETIGTSQEVVSRQF